ncbi:hypothetical protein [Spirosoma sp. KNUC1025]|uniref:hypothetical protein n=1 Tax=Spirosoma sp. KNUC1025 TaxID=2894082 RepID=UPI003865E9CE|nr:hypothetical protein LN737_23465 [Spirosoma sp. KNUC1025]
MQRRIYGLLTGLISLMALPACGQRQELSISPIGLVYPKNQLLQYERYVDKRQSFTVSLGYNADSYRLPLSLPRLERFTNTRGTVGYRYYVPGLGLGDELTIFGSVRAVVDHSSLRLTSDSRYIIPSDSLQAAGFSLAPEFLFGGKATLFNRITLSGAIGLQYLFKLFPTKQITSNQAYWDAVYWTNDQQDWHYKRSVVTSYGQGWYPSVQVTVGVILGKRTPW